MHLGCIFHRMCYISIQYIMSNKTFVYCEALSLLHGYLKIRHTALCTNTGFEHHSDKIVGCKRFSYTFFNTI